MVNGKTKQCVNKDKKNHYVYTEEDLLKYLNEGWELGRYLSPEVKAKKKEKFLKTFYSKSIEEHQEWRRKNSQGGKRRWAATTEADKQKIADKVSTGIKKFWDNLSEEDKKLREQHRQKTRENWTVEEYENYTDKMSQSAVLDRTKRTAEDYKKISEKAAKTHRKNNSFNNSKPEISLRKILVEIFNENDIITEYSDDPRYPFKCDFYIKSEDLFIELNAHWTHGKHPFDNSNPKDILTMNKWIDKQAYYINSKGRKIKNSYFCAVDVWTCKDVIKRNTAKENSLNYIEIFNFKNKDDVLNALKEYI